jgi:DUF4097 and DUF4098 domain-containing protein YvlB
MKGKTIIILILSALLLGVCALCGITTLGTVQWLRANPVRGQIFNQPQISAQVTETYTYNVEKPLTLEVDTSIGDITIRAEDTSQVIVDVTKTGWASNEDEALAIAGALAWKVEQESSSLVLLYDASAPDNAGLRAGGNQGSISFQLTVPVETTVKLRSGMGKLDLEGTSGATELNNSFGDVSVRSLTGSLRVQSNTGHVTLNNIQAAPGNIDISNTFGDLMVNDLLAGDILLNNSSGNLTATALKATGKIEVGGQFTTIQIEDFEATSLHLDNDTGEVNIAQAKLSDVLEASTSFGPLNVIDAKAKGYSLTTQTGNITLYEAQGALNLSSTFGDIVVNRARNAILNLDVSTGTARFSGSLDPSQDHTISTTFGDIDLIIPENSAFNLELDSTFGTINSEIPVSQTGSLNSSQAEGNGRAGASQLNGAMNGGGPTIHADARNGSIHIKINTEIE